MGGEKEESGDTPTLTGLSPHPDRLARSTAEAVPTKPPNGLSFPRRRESRCRVDRAERNPPAQSRRVGCAHHRRLRILVSTPLIPHSWGIVNNAKWLRPSALPLRVRAIAGHLTTPTPDSCRESPLSVWGTRSVHRKPPPAVLWDTHFPQAQL